MIKKIVLLVIFFISIAGLYVANEIKNFYSKPIGLNQNVIVEIYPGKNVNKVKQELRAEGAIFDEYRSKIFLRYYGFDKKFKAGEYEIKKSFSEYDLYKTLMSGKSIQYATVVPEGTNIFELTDILLEKKLIDQDKFKSLLFDPSFIQNIIGKQLLSLEGYLFPDTYFFTKYDGEKKIIKTMVDRFKDRAGAYLEKSNKLNAHQLLTLASIIEKETGEPSERPLISSVFHNRLIKKMKLQTDPTIIYGNFLDTKGVRLLNIKKSDLLKKHPYNTYYIPGLPPGPIANPGLEAIRAALNPEKSSYLFFVSRNNGTHVFTSTYKEHAKAVDELQRKKNKN